MKIAIRFLGLIIVIVFSDQFIKILAERNLSFGEEVIILPQVLSLINVKNIGAAYNLFEGERLMLIIIPTVMILVGFFILFRYALKETWIFPLSITMILAGGIGNLIDRAAKGYVVDYINIHIIPVFNIADISVTLGSILLLIYVIFFDETRKLSNNSK
ncbi:MAG: signal peptidase II [Anaerovoracaceae bacterium]